jgi:hypothetical protein
MPRLERKAEGGGFEPPSELAPRNGFRDRRIRPLCHPSAGEATKPRQTPGDAAAASGRALRSRAGRGVRAAEGARLEIA